MSTGKNDFKKHKINNLNWTEVLIVSLHNLPKSVFYIFLVYYFKVIIWAKILSQHRCFLKLK